MKNLILILSLFAGLLISNTSKAQVSTYTMTAASTNTVTNSGTNTLTAQVKGAHDAITVEYVATKVSGTVGGNATLYGSVNGEAYSAVPVAVIKGGVNAYTNTDITTNSYVWVITPSVYQYYRVLVSGTGTMVATISGTVLVR